MKRFILTLIAVCLGAAAVSAQDWAKFYKYEEANAQVTQKPKAVFMGDSITEGWAKQDPDFFTSNNFIGRGISGQTTSHMLVRFRRDVIDHAPEYVFILAGTNDIAKNNGDITHENILGNIMSMCELAQFHGIIPVLCSVLPADRYKWREELAPAQDIVALNKMIKAYAEAENIMYIDFHSVMRNENDGLPEEYAPDGVHPSMAGFKIMEEIVLKAL